MKEALAVLLAGGNVHNLTLINVVPSSNQGGSGMHFLKSRILDCLATNSDKER